MILSEGKNMTTSFFIIILKYITPPEKIDKHRDAHLSFLDEQYTKNIFIASEAKVPRTGGIIIAKSENRGKLEQILSIVN